MNIVARALSMIALVAALGPQQAFAADYYRINDDSSAKIDEHSVCKVVTNKFGTPANIPTNLASEWSTGSSNFINNIPENLIVTSCQNPDVFSRCPPSGASTPYGRRPTIVVVATTRSERSFDAVGNSASARLDSGRNFQNEVRGAVDDMVDEMQACGGAITFTYVEGWIHGTYDSNTTETGGVGTGNQDSATFADWFASRNVGIASQGALARSTSRLYDDNLALTNAIKEGADYMRSLIRTSPNNARYVFVVTGDASHTDTGFASRARTAVNNMRNEAAAQQNDVEIVVAGISPYTTASYYGVPGANVINAARSELPAILWSVGRNASMYSVGQAANMRFNTAQRAVFGN